MTQEFHISVTPVGESEYLVRTEKVEPGVPLAEEQVIWPLGDWLSQARQLMSNPLIGLLQGGTVNSRDMAISDAIDPSEPIVSLMDLGQQLYGHLFQGILRDSWMTAQGIAQHRGEALRLRLGLKGTLLSKLPWEVMHSGRDGMGMLSHPLSTGTHLLFSRYQPGTAMVRPGFDGSSQPVPTLRILMAIAAPTDQVQLQLKREASHLQQELRLQPGSLRGGLVGTLPDIQLTILEQPSREELAQALEQGQYQILHYAGHSNLDAAGGHLYLVNRRTGLTETLSGDDLAGLLVNNGIRMAVFNSCRGASSAVIDTEAGAAERSLTDALVSRGIPAVLAMAEQIPDEVALTLTRLFYRNLKQGYPVDLSLSRARQGLLSAYGSHQLYWALPTLYLHPDFNGYLTGRDRLLDNPADSLVSVPQLHTPPAPAQRDLAAASQSGEAAFSDSVYLHPMDDSDLEIGIGSEDEFLIPEDDFVSSGSSATDHDAGSGNPYEDEFVVAELIQQLSQNGETQSEPGPASSTAAHSATGAIAPTNPAVPTAGRKGNRPTAGGALATANSSVKLNPHPSHQPQMVTSGPPAAVIAYPRRPWLQSKRVLLPLLGAAGVAIALVGYQVSQVLYPSSPNSQPGVISEAPTLPPEQEVNLLEADAETVAQVAMYHFNNDQLHEGQAAVQILIDRGEIQKAMDALNAVPDNQIGEPHISFLQGRLAWESIRQGETDFSVQDARQFWEYAAQKHPSPSHYNALGFALYTEGNIEDAVDIWLKTLDALQSQGIVVSSDTAEGGEGEDTGFAVPDQQVSDPDALTAYAGIALALAQMSANPTPDQPANLLSKAIKIQQMVVLNGQGEFEADRLEASWLWTDAMVREWRLLSQLRTQ
ncbi:MAG: CHAT domain-containing protein [Synechococcales bacterium]|nr:CHAT domain-containing protein [Synechococcales bacterium]